MLGGNVLWFQPQAIDFVMIGLTILSVGLAMILYSVLALREMRNPDRRDLGTTPAVRWMIIGSILLLILFLFAYNKTGDLTLGQNLIPGHPFIGYKLVQLLVSIILGSAIFMALGAFALRLHYLMRPIRKRTMSILYIVSALGLAQTGAIFLMLWVVAYPLLASDSPMDIYWPRPLSNQLCKGISCTSELFIYARCSIYCRCDDHEHFLWIINGSNRCLEVSS